MRARLPASLFLLCVDEKRVFHAQRAFFTHMGLEALIELCFPAQTRKESDIEMATAQMERALRVEGWL